MMRLSDRYVAFSPSSLQSMFAECVAVIKLCGNVAKLLVDSTAISWKAALEESSVMGRASWEAMRPCAQSGSQRFRSGEKIGECHIVAGGNRCNDALVPGLRCTN